MKVAIVGRGRVGRGLAAALSAGKRSVEVTLHAGRDPGPIAAKTIVLAVPDPAIPAVARGLALRRSQTLVHCSGSLGADALPPGPHGVMHPLVSFADPSLPPNLAGTTFVVDGHPRAVKRAKAIARAVGARCVVAPVHGPTYHAVAALSANGAAALASIAVRVLASIGLTQGQAQRAIGALLRTVAENVEHVGVPDALSGPVIRGDVGTVSRHRAALESNDPEARAAYDAIAPAILDCARRAGLPQERVEAVRRALGAPPDTPPGTGVAEPER